jgi:hypothetical protein
MEYSLHVPISYYFSLWQQYMLNAKIFRILTFCVAAFMCIIFYNPDSLASEATISGHGHITMGGLSINSGVAYIGGTVGQATPPALHTTDEFLLHSGFWYPTWSGIVSDVPTPTAFKNALYANSPNPFNPSTAIRYSLASSSAVTVEIFNLKGRLVRSLVESMKGPGLHDAVWNGRDNHNQNTGSGVYLVRIRTNEFQDSIKISLLK